ncbi:MAG: serine/threonine protein kinase [Planctomycetes bacterium]|nr:serine/threonine protein kinase [Planctomycetota bacterium]
MTEPGTTDDDTITISHGDDATAEVAELTIPREIGPIQLLHEIGRGGMGVVYLGRDRMLGRDVAVKFLLGAEPNEDDPGFVRFLEGARAAAAVTHPGLTTIHHADVIDSVPYLAMEYIEGPTLREIVRKTGPLQQSTALSVVGFVADAVGDLHDRDIVHRDLKPSNVLMDMDGGVHVTDFGLSCPRSAFPGEGGRRRSAGTPAYMAPEMFDGAVSPRTDVYALGIMLYELLTGAVPFSGALADLERQHRAGLQPVEALRERGVDSALIDVVERAAHQDRLFRYKSARQFLRALDGVKGGSVLAGAEVELRALVARCASEAEEKTRSDQSGSDSGSYFDRLATLARMKRRDRSSDGDSDASTERVDGDSPPDEVPADEMPPDGTSPQTAPTTVEPTDAHDVVAADPLDVAPADTLEPLTAYTLDVDVPCVQCTYNLRGLQTDARCPECGALISESTRPDRLMFADPRWLSRLMLGVAVSGSAVASVPVFFALIGPVLLLSNAVSFDWVDTLFDWLAVLMGFASGAALTVGVFLATTTRLDRASKPDTRAARLRMAARAGCLVCIAGVFVSKVVLASAAWSAPMVEVLHAVGLALLLTGGLIGAVGFLGYLSLLAARAPSPKLSKEAKRLVVLLAILALMIALRPASRYVGSVNLSPNVDTIARYLGMGMATFLVIGSLATVVGFPFLMNRYRRMLKEARRHARAAEDG